MEGSKHYAEAERLLSDASFVGSHGHPVNRAGYLLQPGEHASLVGLAQVHATLALAAATALPTVVHFMGDNTEVTAWGRAVGATNDGTEPEIPDHTCDLADEDLDPLCTACMMIGEQSAARAAGGSEQVAHTGNNVRCDDIDCPCQGLAVIGFKGLSRACELELHDKCPGCASEAHKPQHNCVPFGTPEQLAEDRATCPRCTFDNQGAGV